MRFNPLTKLVIIVLATFVFLANVSLMYEIVFIGFLGILLLINGDPYAAMIYWLIFSLLLLLSVTVFKNIHDTWSIIGSFLIIGGRRILPTIMAATFEIKHTHVSEWMRSLQRMHVPFDIILPLVVVFRFFPTLTDNLKNIIKALQFRGLIFSKLALIVHPVRAIEYVLVPMISSADTVASELSSVVITRGISHQGIHTSIFGDHLRFIDYIVITSSILFIVGRWLID